MLFWPILGHFWYPVVTMVTFISNVSDIKKNPKKNISIKNQKKISN